VLLLGCESKDPPPVDGGRAETRPTADLVAEAAGPDLGAADSLAPACPAGLDLKPLSLDPAYCVLHRAPFASAPTAATATADRVWSLASAGSPASGVISEQTVEAGGTKLGATISVFGFALPAGKFYLGTYLARSPSGASFAAGYTEDQTFDGAIYLGTKGGAPTKIEKAQGNYDALFLDDQTLLVNGSGLDAAQEGQGVYLWRAGSAPRRLLKDLGTMSGQLALGPGVLHAGGFFSDGNKLYGFSLAEIKAAIASGKTLSAGSDGDLIYAGGSLDATTLGDDLVIAKMNPTTYAVEGVQRIAVTVAGDKLSAGTTSTICTPAGGVTIDGLAGDGQTLAILLAGGKELAAVRRK
jgi:hypothetical protein